MTSDEAHYVTQLITERDALKKERDEACRREYDLCTKEFEAREAIAASRRQVEGLKEALKKATAGLAAAISAYDKYRNKGITGDPLYSTRIKDFNGYLDEARSALSTLDVPQESAPDPRDAIIAEAMKAMRPYYNAWKSVLDLFDRPHTPALIEAVTKHYIKASHLKAAHAFVERHEKRSKSIIDDAELPIKENPLAGPAIDAWNNDEVVKTYLHEPKPFDEMTEEELLAGLEFTKSNSSYQTRVHEMPNLKNWLLEKAGDEPIEAVVIGEMNKYAKHTLKSYDTQPRGKVLSWNEAVSYIDYEFNNGYGAPRCNAIYAWTKTKVICTQEYEGIVSLFVVPRHPIDCFPEMT